MKKPMPFGKKGDLKKGYPKDAASKDGGKGGKKGLPAFMMAKAPPFGKKGK